MRIPLAWPTLERLAYNRDLPRVHALRRWRDLVCPDRPPEASNDNDLAIDSRHGIRPGEGELMAAIGCQRSGDAWSETYRKPMPTYTPPDATPMVDGPTVRLGLLEFRRGELVSYQTASSRTFKAGERYGAAKGAATRERSEASVRSYLALRGTTGEPGGLQRPMSGAPAAIGQRDWSDLPDGEKKRDLLAHHGVSHHFTLAQARANAGLPESDKLPDFILPGRQWIGGISHQRPTGKGCKGAPPQGAIRQREVEDMDRRIDLGRLRQMLGHHALVLDMAVSPASAAQIAEARGYSPSTARKVGTTVIDRALDAFMALDAENDNKLKKDAA